MLNIYTVNPGTLVVTKSTSEADCRGVGDYEIVSPYDLTLVEIEDYCNANWIGRGEDGVEDWAGLEWEAPMPETKLQPGAVLKCTKCGNQWVSRVLNPVQCPRCHKVLKYPAQPGKGD